MKKRQFEKDLEVVNEQLMKYKFKKQTKHLIRFIDKSVNLVFEIPSIIAFIIDVIIQTISLVINLVCSIPVSIYGLLVMSIMYNTKKELKDLPGEVFFKIWFKTVFNRHIIMYKANIQSYYKYLWKIKKIM